MVVRVILVLTGIVEAWLGLWAQLAPSWFYPSFPGWPWQGWVSMDGPYNEHLIRDFGGLNLALAAVLIGAAVIGSTSAARLAGVALLLFSLPHTWYHWAHDAGYPAMDRVPGVAAAAVEVVVALVVLAVPGRRAADAADLAPVATTARIAHR